LVVVVAETIVVPQVAVAVAVVPFKLARQVYQEHHIQLLLALVD
jgi:hypothetical protein